MNTYLPKKTENLPILVILLMMVSGVFSACFVLSDVDRPEGYLLLWLLPTFFCLDCFIAYHFRRFIFTRISVTMIVGLYWIRMVVTPVFMVLGDYAIVTDNTSWHIYLDQAISLECYESVVVFFAMLALSRHLKQTKLPHTLTAVSKKIRYSGPFLFAIGCLILFYALMYIRWPILIRNQYIPIWGAPSGWTVRVEELRSLDGSGNGPWKVFVVFLELLFPVVQILLPALILTRILNQNRNHSRRVIVIKGFALIACVFIIATESRVDSVIATLALTLTFISYLKKDQLRLARIGLCLLPFGAIAMLWVKQGSSDTSSTFSSISQMLTAYFSGPQNLAASIQAGKQLGHPDPSLFLTDFMRFTPIVGAIAKRVIDLESRPVASILTNQALYGVTERSIWDQLIPAIGEGYMYFGFLLAPLIPLIIVILAMWFESLAQKANLPIWKNIYYFAAIAVSYCSVSGHGIATAMTFLWFVAVASCFAFFNNCCWRDPVIKIEKELL